MNILIIVGDGIGGTEKAAFLFASELARRGHRVIAQASEVTPRVCEFLKAGGQIESFPSTAKSIETTIKKYEIHVIHQHVSGYGDHRELYAALDHLGENRPKLIETNVFGELLDFHDRNHVDMRMFVSLTSGVQAFRRTRMISSPPDIQKQTVLYNPLSPDEGCEKIDRDSFRDSLGVSPEDFVVVRVGRPGHKWTRWECQAHKLARRKNPNLRLILMEPTSAISLEINDGRYGDGIIVLPATSDFKFISGLYQSADLMLHASGFGESFGYTLAEAMIAGLPIITRATAWGDNAQTELVSHDTTGYVCGSVRGMAMGLLELSRNPTRCREMGIAARNRIDSIVSLEKETDLLEEVLSSVMSGQQGPLMNERFRVWQEYDRNGYSKASSKRYEADHRLLLSLISGTVYETFRCIRALKQYFNLRSKSPSLAFPKILASWY